MEPHRKQRRRKGEQRSLTQGVAFITLYETYRGKTNSGRSLCGPPSRAAYALVGYPSYENTDAG